MLQSKFLQWNNFTNIFASFILLWETLADSPMWRETHGKVIYAI